MSNDNPFSSRYLDSQDDELILKINQGSREALEELIKKHQHFIYNVALKMTLSPFDAEDLTQEVLLKIVTKLPQFKGNSSFRTWAYRITFNHFLKMKQKWLENFITSFDQYGSELENMKDSEMSEVEKHEMKELIAEANISCMSGMLLCLSRDQRLVYVLAEIFGIDHSIGSQMIGLSKANFRQRLSRARNDLYQFMNNKCGLVNLSNSCRCERKTNAFIRAGWVDKEKMKFNTEYLRRINKVVLEESDALCELSEVDYKGLFRKHPFQEKEHHVQLMNTILSDSRVRRILNPE